MGFYVLCTGKGGSVIVYAAATSNAAPQMLKEGTDYFLGTDNISHFNKKKTLPPGAARPAAQTTPAQPAQAAPLRDTPAPGAQQQPAAEYPPSTQTPHAERPEQAYPVRPGIPRISAGYPAYPGGAQHRGIDFATPEGTAIYSVGVGTVKAIDNSHPNDWNTYNVPNNRSYGNCVRIQLSDGKTTVIYAHMHNDIQVSVGESVFAGMLIGYSGNTGHSSGAHLHFEVNVNGQPVNPVPYLPDLSVFPGIYQ